MFPVTGWVVSEFCVNGKIMGTKLRDFTGKEWDMWQTSVGFDMIWPWTMKISPFPVGTRPLVPGGACWKWAGRRPRRPRGPRRAKCDVQKDRRVMTSPFFFRGGCDRNGKKWGNLCVFSINWFFFVGDCHRQNEDVNSQKQPVLLSNLQRHKSRVCLLRDPYRYGQVSRGTDPQNRLFSHVFSRFLEQCPNKQF